MTPIEEGIKLGDRLAVERTAMAADRTLMAWTRTAISMISFGFTIYKIMQSLVEEGVSLAGRTDSPRTIGLFLIGIGTLSLALGMVEHSTTKRTLGKLPRRKMFNPSFLTSVVILLLGAFLFVTIISKFEMF